MTITIGSNVASLRAVRQLAQGRSSLDRTLEQLSSGQRINRASDDTAGLAISETLNSQGRIYGQALRNISDGVSLLNIAEGSLSQMSNILSRQKELATQAANGVYSAKQRAALEREANALVSEFNRIAESTEFNGVKVLDGTLAVNNLRLQAGFGEAESFDISMNQKMGHFAGTGGFATGSTLINGGALGLNTIYGATVGDMNNDGLADIVYSGQDYGIYVQIGNGDGTFLAGRSYAGAASHVFGGAALRDFNNDGNLDVAIQAASDNATSTRSTMHVWFGRGDGTLSGLTTYSAGTAQSGPVEVLSDDLNDDGNWDLVGRFGSQLGVFWGQGGGRFSDAHSFDVGGGYTNLKDVNGDNSIDIIAGDSSGKFHVRLGNGDGTFRASTSYGGTFNQTNVLVDDYTNDGIADVVTFEITGSNVQVFAGNGDGSFRSGIISATSYPGNPFAAGTGDFNDDGNLDLVVKATHDTYHGVFLGNGNGTFRAPTSYSGGGAVNLTVADLNHDGVDDLINVGSLTPQFKQGLLDRSRFIVKMDKLDFNTKLAARDSLNYIDLKFKQVSDELGNLGAHQSRMETSFRTLGARRVNILQARGRIVDSDVAGASADLVRKSIIQESAAAVLGQANQQPQLALRLLQL